MNFLKGVTILLATDLEAIQGTSVKEASCILCVPENLIEAYHQNQWTNLFHRRNFKTITQEHIQFVTWFQMTALI